MTWAKIDCTLMFNPKLSGLSCSQKLTYVYSILAAKQLNRDGLFGVEMVCALTGIDVTESDVLVEHGLWEHDSDGRVRVHDYTKHNDSVAEQERKSAVRSEAGRKGGRPRKQNESNLLLDVKANGKQTESILVSDVKANEKQNETKMKAEKRREELINPPTPQRGESEGGAKRKPRTTGTAIPDEWQPSQANMDLARQMRLDLDSAVTIFTDWAIAGGKTYKDWNRTFANALRSWLPQKIRQYQSNLAGMDEGMTRQAELERNAAELKAAYKRLNQQSEDSAFTEPPF